MTNLGRSAKKDTIGMIATVVLYGIGAVSVPYVKVAAWMGGGKILEWYLAFAFKTLCSILPVYLVFQFGNGKMFRNFSGGIKGAAICIAPFLVAVNNLPFMPFITGDMAFNEHIGGLFPYILYCLSIGILEETIFRATLLPLFVRKFGQDKKGLTLSVVVSSAVFGAMHLLNLLGGFSPSVFLQVGYSFLIGCVCSITLLASGSVYVPILIHALFDVGGFLLESGFVVGELWTTGNVIYTLVSSIILAIIIVITFFKSDFSVVLSEWEILTPDEE